MEEYFKWKIILDYVVPLGILGIVGIVCLIYIACQTVKDIRVAHFFEKMDIPETYLVYLLLVARHIMDGLEKLTICELTKVLWVVCR